MLPPKQQLKNQSKSNAIHSALYETIGVPNNWVPNLEKEKWGIRLGKCLVPLNNNNFF